MYGTVPHKRPKIINGYCQAWLPDISKVTFFLPEEAEES